MSADRGLAQLIFSAPARPRCPGHFDIIRAARRCAKNALHYVALGVAGAVMVAMAIGQLLVSSEQKGLTVDPAPVPRGPHTSVTDQGCTSSSRHPEDRSRRPAAHSHCRWSHRDRSLRSRSFRGRRGCRVRFLPTLSRVTAARSRTLRQPRSLFSDEALRVEPSRPRSAGRSLPRLLRDVQRPGARG